MHNKVKILILEDNTFDADLTQRGLLSASPDYQIEIAPTLKMARDILKKDSSFDVALLDMQLPDGSGFDLLLEIRQLRLNMAVIVLTSSGNEETAVTALKAGADDYIVKKTDYISKLPHVIEFAISRFKQKLQEKSEIIKVLYAEHNFSDIDLTLRHLKQYAPHIQIDTVPTAEEALSLFAKKDNKAVPGYDLILMDYRLPGLTALEFIKQIRQEQKLCIPIILVSGHGDEEVAVQALKLGANDYLMKVENYLFRLPSLIMNAYQHCQLKKKQEALLESESKYRLLADNSGDVIFILNMDLKYTYISPAVKILRGFEPEEALKQDLQNVLTPASFQKVKEIVGLLFENVDDSNQFDRQQILELEMIRKDKSTVWTEVKASLFLDDDNKPVGILGVTRDISERMQATVELLKLSTAVEQSPASIVITDPEGIIEYINPKFTELTGYTLQEIKGKRPNILKSGYTTDIEYKELWKTIKSGGEWRGEFLNKRKDESFFWEQVSISSIKNNQGQLTHLLAVKEDVTVKKKQEEELIEAKEKAEESDRLKTAFLHNISHEIRTPMNAIVGFSGLINNPGLSSEKRKNYTDLIVQSSNNLLAIITDIINIATIEAGQETIQERKMNLNALCRQMYNQYKAKAEQKNISLQIKSALSDEEAYIRTDETKLLQIISNLLDNALKFTLKGFVKYGYKIEENFIEFYIKDSGVGIAKEMHGDIFKRFRQVDLSEVREFGGSGLGLSISKAYVELLGGEIWLNSKKEKGSDFYFTIPFYPIVMENYSPDKNIQIDSAEFSEVKTILVAEDEELNFELIEEVLADAKLKIIRAKNGKEAVELCKSGQKIDLILMDIKMPVMDGYEATKLIRKINPELPIIAQTAYSTAKDKQKALTCGCNDFISKPYNQDLLLTIIKKLLVNS